MKFKVLLVLLVLLGAFLRFYNLDWGGSLFFHPDEYHLVISANQLSFPFQMNPHFFSYGTVTIYLIYFTNLLLSIFTANYLPANATHQALQAGLLPTTSLFLIGRFYSALFSTLTIPLIYFISLKILPKPYALLATFFTVLTPGLIQQAHFATPESALIFFLFASIFCLINFLEKNTLKWLFLASVCLGLALAVKISTALFLPVAVLAVFIKARPSPSKFFKFGLLSFIIIILSFFIAAPFVFLDFPGFCHSFQYESRLAMGQISVFYTRQFIDTIPVLFQIQKILPYALGPALLVFGLTGLALMVVSVIKKSSTQKALFLILTAFFLLFLTNAFLFAKWTRFSSLIFPFFALFAAFLFFQLSRFKLPKLISFILYTLYFILFFSWTLAFFSIYTRDDVRVTASRWLEENIPAESVILLEEGNMIDLPLKGNFEKISLDFYSLEGSPSIREKLVQALEKADYFLIQSRRVFLNHLKIPEQFPQTAKFYNTLFSGQLGFEQIQEFHSYPQLQIGPPAGGWALEFPDEQAEETWSVFDHPVIRVFKKK